MNKLNDLPQRHKHADIDASEMFGDLIIQFNFCSLFCPRMTFRKFTKLSLAAKYNVFNDRFSFFLQVSETQTILTRESR